MASDGWLLGTLQHGYFIDIGLPRTVDQARRDLPSVVRRPRFLDRDGVINIDHGYVHRWDQLDLLPGLAEVIRAFNEAGWFVFVITNQSGVARATMTKGPSIFFTTRSVTGLPREARMSIDSIIADCIRKGSWRHIARKSRP